jgi:hypothetical protein
VSEKKNQEEKDWRNGETNKNLMDKNMGVRVGIDDSSQTVRYKYTKTSSIEMKSSLIYIVLWIVASLMKLMIARPVMQRILINNHEWEVPNEPGWKQVIEHAESVQDHLFSSCRTVNECRRIIDAMRAVFLHYPVSRKYLENDVNDVDDILASIFKWG